MSDQKLKWRPNRFSPVLLLVNIVALCLCCHAFAYELSEVDGDDVAGNAPALLGWHESELPLLWAVVEGNSPGSPVSITDYVTAVENSFKTWEDVTTSKVCFEKATSGGATDGVIALTEPVTGDTFSPARSLGDGRTGPPADDGVNNVVYCVQNGWIDSFGMSSSALAVTIFAYSTDTRLIAGGDIFINCDSFAGMWNIIDENSPDPAYYDLQNTITHEIGHFIGLAHPYADGRETSTMYYSATGGETSKRELTEDDINGANYLYPEPGVILIPPDTNTDGLKSLSNPQSNSGCSICTPLTGTDCSLHLFDYTKRFSQWLVSYLLLGVLVCYLRRRRRACTNC